MSLALTGFLVGWCLVFSVIYYRQQRYGFLTLMLVLLAWNIAQLLVKLGLVQ